MERPEPFRALIEQALADAQEPRVRGTSPALQRRLDQVSLPGATPPRGVRPMVPLRVAAPPVTRSELATPTRKIERPNPLDALIDDAVACAEMTREMPPQSLPLPPAPPPKLAAMPELAVPAPVPLPRPPPLPPRRPKPVTPVEPLAAPVPKIMQVLDDVTIPGAAPTTSSDRKTRSSDFYRLHLEFEDTPARPLPPLASLLPIPAAPAARSADAPGLGGVESTDLNRLDELEGIADLDLLAQALGLKSVTDVSIPSEEGEPLAALTDDTVDDDEEPTLPPRGRTAFRKAAVMAALSEDGGDALPVERPKLQAKGAVQPVIVRIPSRPKVSARARARAHNLYLSAIDALGQGDHVGAVGHLKLAVHYDESVPLYRDLLAQLER